VDEGQRYKFGDIAVESTVEGLKSSDLQALVETSKGSVYNAHNIQKSMEAISKRVSAAGYPFARVVPRGNRNFENNTIGVTYLVDQGERAYVERIEIRGNTRTRDYVIRREFDISEGDAFNQETISRAKRRLEALGYFTTVKISTAPGSSPDRVVVVVDVEDQPTGSFGVGAGYSVGGDGLILEASVEEKNFLGRGQFIRVAAGGGLNDSQTYNFSFTEPYFLGYRLATGFDIYKSRTGSNDDYDYTEQGATIRVTAPITENLGTTFRYNYKQLKYTDGESWLSQPYQDLINGSPWVQSTVSQTLTYNTLDDRTIAREGVYATFTHEYAGLGGNSDFYKLYGKAKYFHSLSDEQDIIGMVSASAGHVTPTNGNLKPFDQFMIGGNEIRGFERQGIGPRMPNGDALGGQTYFTVSAEASMPVPGVPQDFNLRAAAFADAGTLFGNDVQNSSGALGTDMTWRASVGAGIVWVSPFGPLRFDYAVPVKKEEFDKQQRFRFSIANQF
jgi:outer membrane protein insertion porin family